MSNKSLEQALANLLPTHAEALPPELIQHAASLLAQSRSYGSSLKPDEEIARPYACAEIACRRLSKKLKLPPLLGRPPCPPRVYKKLYNYLEQALLKASTGARRDTTTTTSASNTPRKATVASTSLRTPSKATSTPIGTSHKRALPTTPSQKSASRPKAQAKGKSNGISKKAVIKDAPTWTMPVIRRVCKTLSTRTPTSTPASRPAISTRLPPHIFAGISSILFFVSQLQNKERGEGNQNAAHTAFLSPLTANTDPESQDKTYRDRITELIVAVYFVVLARRRPNVTSSSTSANKLDVAEYLEMSAAALAGVGLEGKRYVDDVDMWLAIIMTRSWTKGTEWFDNVPGPGQAGEEEYGELDEGMDEDEDDEDEIVGPKRRKAIRRETRRRSGNVGSENARERSGLLPGLGTMMQERLDWLSEERREDYMLWREGVMERIRGMGVVAG
ncbi:hypothetical protein FQN55_001634 [Onygenales sp. PD_40]|nr:hypothetical protein FQN55_001634 [Onygenales sp. PD_40]KAK2788848.1 hypothetical protein FQN53_003035 [Emmonsiellopsis sp. PD_33]